MKRIILTLTLALFTLPILNAQDLPSYVPTEGLVAYYPFNGNANDASGNGNHGTVNGATLANDQNGNDNKAYEFNVNESASWGSPQEEIEIDFSTSMNSNLLTLSAWVNPREKPSPYNDRSHSIFGRWEGGVQNEIFRFVVGNDNALYFQISDGNNNIENYSGGNVPYDSWTHVSAVLNEKNIKLYVNGQKVSDELFVNNINTTGNSDLTIASMPMSNGTWYFFDGHLDEMGYWNRALSEQEIQNLYNSSSGDIILNGVVSAESNQIKNVADPTDNQDAATKNYVDSNVNAFSGSYSDLTDTPLTITTQQASDIITNNAKTTFPGFGTTSGTALAGDTALFSGSYNDLTDKPAGTYTQSEVDALISDLQDQIDAMQASTGPETYTILDQYTDNIPTGTNYVKLTYYDQYVDAGSIDASPFVITKQTAHEGGILFYGSTELNSKNLENTFRLTASTGNFDFISFNLDNLESNIDYGTESTTTLPRITLTSSSGSSVTYEATVDAYTSDGYTYYTYMFMESGVKSLNWDNVEWVDIKTQYTKAKVKDFILKKL